MRPGISVAEDIRRLPTGKAPAMRCAVAARAGEVDG
jgi:hypothetical protein